MKIDDLITRISAASEGSRELDHLLNIHLFGNRTNCKKFTASMDAAIDFVQRAAPNHGWTISTYDHAPTVSHVTAFVHPAADKCIMVNAPTSPLALCLGALEARKAADSTGHPASPERSHGLTPVAVRAGE